MNVVGSGVNAGFSVVNLFGNMMNLLWSMKTFLLIYVAVIVAISLLAALKNAATPVPPTQKLKEYENRRKRVIDWGEEGKYTPEKVSSRLEELRRQYAKPLAVMEARKGHLAAMLEKGSISEKEYRARMNKINGAGAASARAGSSGRSNSATKSKVQYDYFQRENQRMRKYYVENQVRFDVYDRAQAKWRSKKEVDAERAAMMNSRRRRG